MPLWNLAPSLNKSFSITILFSAVRIYSLQNVFLSPPHWQIRTGKCSLRLKRAFGVSALRTEYLHGIQVAIGCVKFGCFALKSAVVDVLCWIKLKFYSLKRSEHVQCLYYMSCICCQKTEINIFIYLLEKGTVYVTMCVRLFLKGRTIFSLKWNILDILFCEEQLNTFVMRNNAIKQLTSRAYALGILLESPFRLNSGGVKGILALK